MIMDIENLNLPDFAFLEARGIEKRSIIMHMKARVAVEAMPKSSYMFLDLGDTPTIEFSLVTVNGIAEYILACYTSDGLPWTRDDYFQILEESKAFFISHLNAEPARYVLEDAFEKAINERSVFRKLDTYKGWVLNVRSRYKKNTLTINAMHDILNKLGWKRIYKEIWQEPEKE